MLKWGVCLFNLVITLLIHNNTHMYKEGVVSICMFPLDIINEQLIDINCCPFTVIIVIYVNLAFLYVTMGLFSMDNLCAEGRFLLYEWWLLIPNAGLVYCDNTYRYNGGIRVCHVCCIKYACSMFSM